MAKDLYTGIALREGLLEWTTVRKVRDRIEVSGSGAIRLEEKPAEEPCALPPKLPINKHSKEQPKEETPAPPESAKTQEPPKPSFENEERIRKETHTVEGELSAGLPSSRVLVRVLELPPGAREDIPQMVELQADKFCPFPLDAAVISHEILAENEEGFFVLVAATRTDAAEAVESTISGYGLTPERMDVDALGRWRSMRDSDLIKETKGRHVILYWDSPEGAMMVVENGIPILFQNLGFSAGMSRDEIVRETLEETRHTLVALELERGSFESCVITVMHDEDAAVPLVEALAGEFECEVRAHSFSSQPSVSEGLARRAAEGGVIDLTPEKWKAAAATKLFKKKLITFAAVVLGVWLLGMGSIMGGIIVQKQRLERLETKLEGVRPEAMKVRRMRRRVFTIERYMDRSESALEYLREISSILPEQVELTSFIFKKDESVRVSGEANSVDAVYEFKKRVDQSGLFQESRLSGPRHDRRKRKDVFDLTVIAKGGEE